MPQLQQIMEALDRLAPWNLAESWDRVGLQAGSLNQSVTRILVSLDINQQIIQEGLAQKADGFIVHHPLLFKPLTQINYNTPIGRCLSDLISNRLFLIAAHTNVDKAACGLNQFLAEQLQLSDIELLEPATQTSYKVVVFTPAQSMPRIRNAMAQAGAGAIGDYTECSFSLTGEGAFKPGYGARPFIGRTSEFTQVTEIRLEMLASERDLSRILKAITAHHPYEEPVIDVYPLAGPAVHGMGRIGKLKTPLGLQDLCSIIKEQFAAGEIRVLDGAAEVIKKLAICSGSGGSLLAAAVKNRADAFFTGELNYHDFLWAKENGIAVIAAGHWSTEHVFTRLITDYLNNYFRNETDFKTIPSTSIQEEPYRII